MRVAAALALFAMAPMWFSDFQPLDYHLGSQTVTYLVCPYLSAMACLGIVSLVGTRLANVCPRCGHKTRTRSFQMTRSANPQIHGTRNLPCSLSESLSSCS